VQTLGKGSLFGEGSVLFDRLRSATVEVQGARGGGGRGGASQSTSSSSPLSAFVVSREVFVNSVLPTPELRQVFDAKALDGFIDMDSFVEIVADTAEPEDYIKVMNVYNILRKVRRGL